MITKTQLREGLKVLFLSRKGCEEGRVSSWNDRYVFVIYNGNTSAQATRYEDLQIIPEKEPPVYQCTLSYFSKHRKTFMYAGNVISLEEYGELDQAEQINYIRKEEN